MKKNFGSFQLKSESWMVQFHMSWQVHNSEDLISLKCKVQLSKDIKRLGEGFWFRDFNWGSLVIWKMSAVMAKFVRLDFEDTFIFVWLLTFFSSWNKNSLILAGTDAVFEYLGLESHFFKSFNRLQLPSWISLRDLISLKPWKWHFWLCLLLWDLPFSAGTSARGVQRNWGSSKLSNPNCDRKMGKAKPQAKGNHAS